MKKVAKEIILKAKKQVFSTFSGSHLSKLLGEGYDFAELREYSYGDDVKKIDWKTTAKLGKPYIKIYHEERQLNVVVSTMLSGESHFGSKRLQKYFMIELLALLGFSAIKSKDLFSHILFADKLYHISTPAKKIYAVNKEVENAIEFDSIGKAANYKAWSDTLNKKIRKKSLLFLIGNFISNDINLSLLAKKHELFVIIVRDEFLEKPKPLGEATLVDPGFLSTFSGNVDESTMQEYQKAIRENDKKLIKHLKKSGIRFLKIYTYQDPYLELLKRMR
jgi:uncharacterized protein (DUF58 family)